MMETPRRKAFIHRAMGLFGTFFCVYFTFLVCRTAYQSAVTPLDGVGQNSMDAFILGLAFFYSPLAGVFIRFSRKKAFDLAGLNPGLKKILDLSHLLAFAAMIGIWVIATPIFFK